MAYALQFNGSGYVSIPAKTTGSASTDTWTAIFDLEIPNTTDQTIYAATDTATTDYFRITGANTASWRIGSGTINNITISTNWPINTRFKLDILRLTSRVLSVRIDDVEVYGLTGGAFGLVGNAISVSSIGKASVGVFSGKMYEATIQGQNYLNVDQPDTTVWGDGTLTGIPSTNWELYGAVGGTSNITISETLPALSDSMSMTFTPAAGTSNITINDTLPALDSSLSMTYVSGVGTITISDWANNTGTALPSITDITVNVRSLVDGSTIYRTTTASTDVNADCVVSDAAIVSGTQYEVTALKFNGVDYDIGIAIITAT